MTDYREDPAFASAVASVREGIRSMARGFDVPDANALVSREEGAHNLQGHAHSVVPLAVLVARFNPGIMTAIRVKTDLDHSMGDPGSAEARDADIWGPVQHATKLVIAVHGSDEVSEEIGTGDTQDVDQIAETYLSESYGGGQTGGGAADTVLKRTLKLMAHMQFAL